MSHAIECINIILSLKGIFPSDLIRVIIELYWRLRSEPVLLLYNFIDDARDYLVCNFSPTGDSIFVKLLEIKPNLRFCHMEGQFTARHHLVKSNFECASTLLLAVEKAILKNFTGVCKLHLIPGPLWDYAALCPDSEVKNINGIQTHNSFLDIKSKPQFHYIIKHPDEIVKWFKDSLNHPDFLAVQNAL